MSSSKLSLLPSRATGGTALKVSATSPLAFAYYDLKVYSDKQDQSTAVPAPPNVKLTDFCFDRCVDWLDKVGKVVERRVPRVYADAEEDKCGTGESKGSDSSPVKEGHREGVNEGRLKEKWG